MRMVERITDIVLGFIPKRYLLSVHIGASVVQWTEQPLPTTTEVMSSDRAIEHACACELKILSTVWRKSWVISGFSGFQPHAGKVIDRVD